MVTKNKTQTSEKKEKGKPPIAKFRSGAIKATIWEQDVETEEGQKFTNYTFNVERSYKDKQNEWQHTTSFRKQDIGALNAVMNKVTEFIMIDEDEEKKD